MAENIIDTQLPEKPRLVPWVTTVDLGDERLQFRAPRFVFTLQSNLFIQAFELILPLLDGNHSVEEITFSGGPLYIPSTILFLLKILRANGLLVEGADSPNVLPDHAGDVDRHSDFLSQFTSAPRATLGLLQKTRIGLVGSRPLLEHVLGALESMGVQNILLIEVSSVEGNKGSNIRDELFRLPENLDMLIACQETEGFQFFERINKLCLEAGTRWMRVAIEGTSVSLGPTFIPFQTACYTCFGRRIASNLPDSEDYKAYQRESISNNGGRDRGYFPPLWSLTASHVALEVARIVSGFFPPQTIGRFYQIEDMSPAALGHDVLRLPRCPVCSRGDPKRQAWDKSDAINAT